jgi:hypothetical protein
MPAEPSPTNVYVPSLDATGQIIAFIRNPDQFRFNRYVAYRKASKMVGLYMVYDRDNPARIVTEAEYAFPDGAVRPDGFENLDGFDLREYRTRRFDIPFTVGNLTRAQASWDIVAAQAAGRLQQWATLFTNSVVSLLETAANWGGVHVADANTLNGNAGFWDTGDTASNPIQKTIYAAVEAIRSDTNSMVSLKDLKMILGVSAARRIRTSREITDYIKGSPDATAQIRGEVDNPNVDFGLPAKLYGIELVVEDAVRVTSRKTATGFNNATRTFIKEPQSAIIVSKQDGLPGDQVGDFPTPNFSTFQVFYYVGDGPESGEAAKQGPSGLYTVETFADSRNLRLDGHVVTNFDRRLVAPESGYLIQNILSV